MEVFDVFGVLFVLVAATQFAGAETVPQGQERVVERLEKGEPSCNFRCVPELLGNLLLGVSAKVESKFHYVRGKTQADNAVKMR